MCNIDHIFHARIPGSTEKVAAVGGVEVTRADDGVVLHAGPGAPGVKISRLGWGDFAAAVLEGEFDATLDNNDTFRTSDVEPRATDVVEVTRTHDGVFLRVLPGSNTVHIPRKEWWDFIAGIYGKTFDDTLPGVDDFASSGTE
jgi:hypothetical protein